MRDAINNNPLAQLAVVGVLLVAVGFFVLSSGGGEEEETAEPATTEATISTADSAAAPAPVSAGVVPSSLPAPPPQVLGAYRDDRTVVLLFVRDGGIDDRRVKLATEALAGFRDASIFVVPAAEIARYASITQGVGVDRVPALVVVTPKDLKKVVPTASVSYGFQSHASVAQTVIDAGYRGPTIDYHP